MTKGLAQCLPAFLTMALSLAISAPCHARARAKLSPLAEAVDEQITSLEKQFVAVAEAMPADKFEATPETLGIPGSAFKGVRTFGAQVKHVAADNFAIWAPVAGERERAGINAPRGPAEMKTRDDILKFLKESFAYGHKAAAALTEENQLELVAFRGQKVTRLSLVILALTHTNDHYGQMVEYLRMNGVIPPGSR